MSIYGMCVYRGTGERICKKLKGLHKCKGGRGLLGKYRGNEEIGG